MIRDHCNLILNTGDIRLQRLNIILGTDSVQVLWRKGEKTSLHECEIERETLKLRRKCSGNLLGLCSSRKQLRPCTASVFHSSWNTNQGVWYDDKYITITVTCSVKTNSPYLESRAVPSVVLHRGDKLSCWDPKDCELYLNWWKPEETLVDDLETMLTCKSLVWVEYSGERPLEQSSSWFPPKFPAG
jgi:hypothetical protein